MKVQLELLQFTAAMKIIILLALVACAFGATREFRRPIPDGRIVGGEDADISNHPYQLSLQSGGGHKCGASIISANWAVTAAHCVEGYSASSISLRAGTSQRGSGGTVHQASSITVHSNYNSNTIDYDVAVILVTSPFPNSYNVQPIVLETYAVAEGTISVCTGWGALSEGGATPRQLKAVSVPVVSNEKCKDAYGGAITDRMLCAGLEAGGKDACTGDSGGPLAAGGRLIGIVSWGYGCAQPKYPSVYTKVSSVRSWIASNSGV